MFRITFIALILVTTSFAAATSKHGLSPYGHKPTPNNPVPALLAVPHNMPTTSSISDKVIHALRDGKVAIATRNLYLEPASAKNLLLLRDLERIGEVESGLRKPEGDLHRYYMNIGIAYHNLYLFLRAYNIDHKTYAKRSRKAYKKARSYSNTKHRSEVDTLWAALDMIQGKAKRGEHRFNKHVDADVLSSYFRGTTYLATYHAARADIQATLTALHNARRFKEHERLSAWLQVSDDFVAFRDDESFQEFVKSLAEEK